MSLVRQFFPKFMDLTSEYSEEETDSYRVPYYASNYDDETDTIELKIETPGLKKDLIQLKSTERSIAFFTKDAKENDDSIAYKREFYFRHKIKPDSITAKYEDGILTLKIKKDVPKKYDVQIT
ncbi:MAG: hypothetical protein HeimC3_03450 [Candidatus Heimdallarchaeota archaeon LC_3]|nr:MAG: hypothetical protein HeimC3_03450 [Candidatus Heimdallarchaeota archaeon LC_3]